jgi:hypothetical protein
MAIDSIVRVAMWSGPRNISTAMMRSWGNRDDCVVVDEPLYAHYLSVTRKPHPGIEEVIAAGETDWCRTVGQLTGPIPGGKRICYQKQMTHHLLPEMDREWMGKLTNCFLIRDPREVLASYAKIVETPALEDTGFPQQAEIFAWVCERTGRIPPVLDAADVLRDPRRMLGLLCDAVGINFQESMLCWPPGPRATDGVWAKHWYGEVEKSSGFRAYQPKRVELPERLRALCNECEPYYDLLYSIRIK